MDRIQVALNELERILARHLDDGGALTESDLRTACSAAMLAAYPAASGAEHEMDVRALLGSVMEMYGAARERAILSPCGDEALYGADALRDAVRRLRDRCE